MSGHAANHVINFAWTVIGFGPVVIFWACHYDAQRFFISLALSLPFLLMSSSVFKRLQISRQRRFYERLGVRYAQAVTQNGLLMNRWIRRKVPGYSVIRRPRDLRSFRRRMTVYDVYHMACLVFFMTSGVVAVIESEYGIAVLIFITNIIYNIYPLLIQQYNRLRMNSI